MENRNIQILNILEEKLAHLLTCNLLPEKSYLAGGTAVYFYLKHRISVDLDFFTPTAFNADLFVHKMKECFAALHVELMEKNTLILYISEEKIKFSLFLFPFEIKRDRLNFFSTGVDFQSMGVVDLNLPAKGCYRR